MDQSKQTKPADNSLANVVAAQGVKLEHLTSEVASAFDVVQKEVTELRQSSAGTFSAIAKLSEQLCALTTAIASNPANVSVPPPNVNNPADALSAHIPLPIDPVREPHIPTPKPFEGDLSRCLGFITQCELIFCHNPSRFFLDDTKIAFIVSLLSGRALDWAVASLNSDSRYASDYRLFISDFRLVFDHPPDGHDSASRLHSMCQGSRSVADYAVEFRILAAKSGWGDEALKSAFRRGLNDSVKDLILRDRPTTLAELISLSLKVDDRLRERRIEKRNRSPPSVPRESRTVVPRPTSVSQHTPVSASKFPTAVQEIEPMQLGHSRLTQAMRDHRMQNRLCLYCGKSGHFIQQCDVRPKVKDLTH